MKFRRYSSIDNASRTKTVNYITESGNADGEWVSTLKIHGCFPHDTRIDTNKGQLTIGNIVNNKLDVLVKSYNKDSGLIEFKHINNYFHNGYTDDWMDLVIEYPTGKMIKLTTTPSHFFYNENFDKQEVSSFIVGDVVYVNKPSLNRVQQDILLGSFLGDGSFRNIDNGIKSGLYTETHSIKQEAYIEFKWGILENLMHKKEFFKGRYSKNHPYTNKIVITSGSIPDINKLLSEFYCDGKKRITRNIIGKLNPVVVAIWFCDDGYTSFNKSSRPRSKFHTEGFSKEENEILLEALQYIGFNDINTKVMQRTDINNKYYIQLSTDDTEKLFGYIKEFIHPSMQYKISNIYRGFFDIDHFNVNFNDVSKCVINSIIKSKYTGGKYDIEVADNHNYFSNNILVSNSNYSLWCDSDGCVKRGKRSGFIEEDQIFMGDLNFDYNENIRQMFNYLKMVHSEIENLTVCGEIYGGLYRHSGVEKSKSATRVQKEVQYRPDNDFIVFDIKIDNMILGHDKVIKLCETFGFMHVPVLARGSFYDLMKIDTKFPDPLAEMLGLPVIEDNDAEGWVLKPVEPKFFGSGERIILKGKNPDFSEKNGGKRGKSPKPVYNLSDEGNILKDELLSYLTENRLRNVLSHGDIEEITQRDFGRLNGLFCQDAFGDFCKDNGVQFESLPKKERSIIKKNMNRVGGDVIRPNFLEIIDGEF